MKDREKYVLEVRLIVSVEALDLNDAQDMLTEVLGTGELDDLGIECHSIVFEQYRSL